MPKSANQLKKAARLIWYGWMRRTTFAPWSLTVSGAAADVKHRLDELEADGMLVRKTATLRKKGE